MSPLLYVVMSIWTGSSESVPSWLTMTCSGMPSSKAFLPAFFGNEQASQVAQQQNLRARFLSSSSSNDLFMSNQKKSNSKKISPKPPPATTDIHELNLQTAEAPDDAIPPTFSGREDHSLLTLQRQRLYDDLPPSNEWLRPYWLGIGLFLILFSFWVLDTLKDPMFGRLVNGNLELHQPPAKLFSVCLTLCLVCCLEYVSNESKRKQQEVPPRSEQDVLDAGGTWSKMHFGSSVPTSDTTTTSTLQGILRRDTPSFTTASSVEEEDRVSGSIFVSINMPYCIGIGIMAYLLQFNPSVAKMIPTSSSASGNSLSPETIVDTNYTWHALGYFLFAGIESFGSISVATFWSYVNSTLSLEDAERYYGLIISIAQLGAIGGSTMVSTYVWSNITLMVLVCLVILLHILVMTTYARRFDRSHENAQRDHLDPQRRQRRRRRPAPPPPPPPPALRQRPEGSTQPPDPSLTLSSPTLWSGLYLVLKYNYVLLILGASCLYEVSLTCLNYQMTLLGWTRFQETEHEGMNFTRFMGHYGQMVNISSLVLSSFVFPNLIRKFGLRQTLRIFPTLLLLANVLAFGALPGNLAVLFFSMSTLKAMTYSIHDPAKEMLYIPTSNSIKFKSKFWIDVVGARFAKAIGSSINTLAGSVDRSIRVASAPSLLTAIALWWVCYRVGTQFEHLIATHSVVGVEEGQSHYTKVTETVEEPGTDAEELKAGDDSEFSDPSAAEATITLELANLQRPH